MKRSWIGFFLLLVLLGGGFLASWGMKKVHEPISGELELAARAGAADNWSKAAFHTARAKKDWEKWQLLRSAMADHGPSEQLDAQFSVLEVYGSQQESVAFSALAREMATEIEAIGDAHDLVWNNIL